MPGRDDSGGSDGAIDERQLLADEEPAGGEAEDDPQESLDLDERRLCSDGSCTGVLGADGRCRECGRLGEDDEGANPSGEGASASSSDDEDADDESSDSAATDGSDDDERLLCPDGACTGLIGADGRCKECGRSASDSLA